MKAKLLWKRIPIVFKSDPNAELNCIGAVVIKLIQREYAQAFRLINEYQSSGRVWSTPTLTALLTRLVAMSRERYFALVSTAYSSIDVDTLAANVGLDAAETCTIAQHSLGWTLDESGKCLLPKKKGQFENSTNYYNDEHFGSVSIVFYCTSESTGNFEIANQTQMRQLTSLVSFLET